MPPPYLNLCECLAVTAAIGSTGGPARWLHRQRDDTDQTWPLPDTRLTRLPRYDAATRGSARSGTVSSATSRALRQRRPGRPAAGTSPVPPRGRRGGGCHDANGTCERPAASWPAARFADASAQRPVVMIASSTTAAAHPAMIHQPARLASAKPGQKDAFRPGLVRQLPAVSFQITQRPLLRV